MNDPKSRDSRSHDFDFFFGEWRVHHRRLKARLANCNDWEEFVGTCRTQPLLDGCGNLDDNTLELPGDTYRAVTLRAFDPRTGTWAIWWLDGRKPHRLDPPIIGGFAHGVGTFLADNSHDGKPIKVRFLWSRITPHSCRWEQAFSPDGGTNWETNWTMDFARMA
jgi:hypothetical protein